MSSPRKTFCLLLCGCAFVACREPAGASLPIRTGLEESPAAQLGLGEREEALGSNESAGSGKASGHANVHGTPVQNVKDETYSFIALPTDISLFASGQVEVHLIRFTDDEVFVHAEVTCVSIVGNMAWVGSRIRRFVHNGQEVPERVDRPMIFRVLDVGEGEGASDQASLVFFPAPDAGDLEHCNTRPDFPILRESGAGNIQVASR